MRLGGRRGTLLNGERSCITAVPHPLCRSNRCRHRPPRERSQLAKRDIQRQFPVSRLRREKLIATRLSDFHPTHHDARAHD